MQCNILIKHHAVFWQRIIFFIEASTSKICMDISVLPQRAGIEPSAVSACLTPIAMHP